MREKGERERKQQTAGGRGHSCKMRERNGRKAASPQGGVDIAQTPNSSLGPQGRFHKAKRLKELLTTRSAHRDAFTKRSD